MTKHKCSVCNKEFEDEYFDKEQNKCILHCEKSKYPRDSDTFCNLLKEYIDQNSENIIDRRKKLFLKEIIFPDFKPDEKGDFRELLSKYQDIEFFHCKFYNQFSGLENNHCCFYNCEFYNKFTISNIKNLDDTFLFVECCFYQNISFSAEVIESNIFDRCKFPKSSKGKLSCIDGDYTIFNGIIFENIDNEQFQEINFSHAKINKKFILDKKIEIEKLNLDETTFKNKVKIQLCNISEASFYNTSFHDLADFYQTKFTKKVNFLKADFLSISVFSETEFDCDVDFSYVKFFGKAIFRDTVIMGELNLRNTIFDDEANFLDITSQKRKKSYKDEYIGDVKAINVSNRETARIIKNFYDASNNIIEANKFYALEMKKREYELKEAITEGKFKFILEYVIFKLHGISSNHSQDWLLSLLWMLNITFMYTIFSCENNYHNNILATTSFYSIIFTLFIYQNPQVLLKIVLILNTLMFLFISYTSLNTIADKINPFSIMTKDEPITFDGLIYKVIIAYLIYQLIISIRQNTRRK